MDVCQEKLSCQPSPLISMSSPSHYFVTFPKIHKFLYWEAFLIHEDNYDNLEPCSDKWNTPFNGTN